jgi:hypothetical protein
VNEAFRGANGAVNIYRSARPRASTARAGTRYTLPRTP